MRSWTRSLVKVLAVMGAVAVVGMGVPAAFGDTDDADLRRVASYRQPCGFSHDGWFDPAYYTYCGPRGSRARITIEHSSGADTHRCVGTGVNYLGSYPFISYAYYNGERC